MKKGSADIAADFEAVEMLKHVVFMSQMDRPCFSHSKTHVGKSNPKSVEKVIGNLKLIHFFYWVTISTCPGRRCSWPITPGRPS